MYASMQKCNGLVLPTSILSPCPPCKIQAVAEAAAACAMPAAYASTLASKSQLVESECKLHMPIACMSTAGYAAQQQGLLLRQLHVAGAYGCLL